ncbi:unnamed protein product [Zymoseptoria tritici ST99CH_1E4]|uniref:Transferrin receptor-like dimerisation domain-containing protein n=1 Tax=Zymoseptoria tritici ST99CH_1E4 TaxID=1276532 RepID=A0A2H1FWA2_ZYMTR|nr:unnamed protein product [Zymoseptoria tritici ST99CH_1E4]
MADDHKYQQYANIPIPTYDEATSSRPSSSQHNRGPGEVSDDAERQGLLGTSTYIPPTVESPRSSEDSDLHLPEVTGDDDDDNDRRRVEEFDYLDPSQPDPDQRQPRLYHRSRIRSKFLTSIGATLSSIRLPSFRSLYSPVQPSEAHVPTDPPPPAQSLFARIRSAAPSIPQQYRISAPNAARLFGLFTIAILIFTLLSFDVFPGAGRYLGARFDPESVRMYVQDNVDTGRIEEYLTHISSFDHSAGTEGDLYMAEWMKEKWIKEGGLDDVRLSSYYIYATYPTTDGRAVRIVSPESAKWSAVLEEERVDANVGRQQTLVWQAYSESGTPEGHLIFANGGSEEDFAWLQEQGVVLNGSIALMRFGGSQKNVVAKIGAAAQAGCIGALLYSDPRDDGSARGPVWPDGPWRPDDSVQRGSVALTDRVLGDPFTPGYASTLNAEHTVKDNYPALVQIPSLPLSWRDAKVLINSLKNHGKEVPKEWIGGDPDFSKQWFSGGNLSDAPIVHLKNVFEFSDKQQIWNLHGTLKGVEEPEKKVLVGNHRDAWCFGAADPGSGSAVLMEIVNIFGQLRSLGWRPLRTIEFVSWDAKEFNLAGSTEYVEDNTDALRKDAISYLNVDVGVAGLEPQFAASGSPMWTRALLHVLDRVNAPGQNDSLRKFWDETQSRLTSSSSTFTDILPFQHIAGTSSLDFGFSSPQPYPKGSCYDTLEWVKKFGDPDMSSHRTLAQIWALLILEVADRPILPYDLRAYAEKVRGEYIDRLTSFVEAQALESAGKSEGFDLTPLVAAADAFVEAANVFSHFEDIWTANVLGSGGLESSSYLQRRVEYNDALSTFETDLLDIDRKLYTPDGKRDKKKEKKVREMGFGVKGREQFRHVIFGVGENGEEVVFPAVWDAVERGEWEEAQRWVGRVADVLGRAVGGLKFE